MKIIIALSKSTVPIYGWMDPWMSWWLSKHMRVLNRLLKSRAYMYITHFDLSGLISMTLERAEGSTCENCDSPPGFEPGSPNFRSVALTTKLQGQLTQGAKYAVPNIHRWVDGFSKHIEGSIDHYSQELNNVTHFDLSGLISKARKAECSIVWKLLILIQECLDIYTKLSLLIASVV